MVEAMLKFSSNWSSSAFSRDSFPGIDHSYSFESRNVEEIDEYENFPDSSENSIHSVSGSSSEGSDWTSFDEDISNILPVTDGSVSMLLEEGLVDSINVADLNWAELESFSDQTASSASILESTGVSHVSRKKGKRKKSPDHSSSAAQWSRMSRDEQLKTIQALTQVISHNMTLREQIEIISVIDPSAVISPNDTEFAIDLEFLNDSKLQVIKDIVKKHAIVTSSSDFIELQTPIIHNSSSPHRLPSKVKSSKKQVYEKRPYLKEIESRQRKLLRQSKKEKRSGLFLHEKKIKRLSSNPQDEEENVNILD